MTTTRSSMIGFGLIGLAAVPVFGAKRLPPSSTVTVIRTASTNTPGYRVSVASSGRVIYTETDRAGRVSIGKAQSKALPPALAKQLMKDVRAAQPFSSLPVGHGLKSVSFGTSTYLEWNGQRTPDLSFAVNPAERTLASDASAVLQALNLNTPPGRLRGPMTPMLPGH